MEILMLCGSPRMGKGPQHCHSLDLLEQLKTRLAGEGVRILPGNPAEDLDRLAQALTGVQALVLSFPLYVDSIPAGLLGTLTELEQRLKGSQGLERTLVYPLVNCGFFEAAQNRLAISMVWAWCESCGLGQGRALALGGGEMLGGMPAGKGPLADLDKSLDELAQDILAGRGGQTLWVQPGIPRSFYRLAGNLGFRHQGRKNGLTAQQMRQ